VILFPQRPQPGNPVAFRHSGFFGHGQALFPSDHQQRLGKFAAHGGQGLAQGARSRLDPELHQVAVIAATQGHHLQWLRGCRQGHAQPA
jgi:hypothetical protein